jgi:cell division protein FtsN
MVPVATFGTRSEAEIVQGLLASAGIDASISADDAGGAYPFVVLSGGAQLLVDENDVEAATQVLASETDQILRKELACQPTMRNRP